MTRPPTSNRLVPTLLSSTTFVWLMCLHMTVVVLAITKSAQPPSQCVEGHTNCTHSATQNDTQPTNVDLTPSLIIPVNFATDGVEVDEHHTQTHHQSPSFLPKGKSLNLTYGSQYKNVGDLSDVTIDDNDGLDDFVIGSKKSSQCVVNGTTYKHGERIEQGCESICTCLDGKTECRERCNRPFLRTGQTVKDPLCRLKETPHDHCCSIMVCEADTEVEPLEMCHYNQTMYNRGDQFNVGCEKVCRCEAAGQVNCKPRCPIAHETSDKCVQVQDPDEPCCKKWLCDVTLEDNEPEKDGIAITLAVPTAEFSTARYINDTTIRVEFKNSVSNTTSLPLIELSIDEINWTTYKPLDGGLIPTDQMYKFLRVENSNEIVNILRPDEPVRVKGQSPTDSDCIYKNKTFSVGQEYNDQCTHLCVCKAPGRMKCLKLECPTYFGVDVLDPSCVEWETVPPKFVPSPPVCCPDKLVCKSNGSCLHQGQLYDNWHQIPLNVTGCEKRCYCEMGKVECQNVCPTVPAQPPATLPCAAHMAKIAHLPGDDCCVEWTCGDSEHSTSQTFASSSTSQPSTSTDHPTSSPYSPVNINPFESTTNHPSSTHMHEPFLGPFAPHESKYLNSNKFVGKHDSAVVPAKTDSSKTKSGGIDLDGDIVNVVSTPPPSNAKKSQYFGKDKAGADDDFGVSGGFGGGGVSPTKKSSKFPYSKSKSTASKELFVTIPPIGLDNTNALGDKTSPPLYQIPLHELSRFPLPPLAPNGNQQHSIIPYVFHAGGGGVAGGNNQADDLPPGVTLEQLLQELHRNSFGGSNRQQQQQQQQQQQSLVPPPPQVPQGTGLYGDFQDVQDEIVVHTLEALGPHTVRLAFMVPPVIVGLHGRVEVRYTDRRDNSPTSSWQLQVFAPPNDLIATPQLEFDLLDLKANTDYRIKITITLRDLHNTPVSRIYKIKTPPASREDSSKLPVSGLGPLPAADGLAVIPIEPELAVSEVNSTWATVVWRKFSDYELQFIDGVQLRFRQLEGKVYDATPLIHRSVTSYTVEGLQPNTKYELGIFFIPFAGQQSELQARRMVHFSTANMMDHYGFNVTLTILHIKAQSVDIQWTGVPYPEDKYVNIYRAIYQSDGAREDHSTFKMAKRDAPTRTTVSDLKPGTRYRLWLEIYLTNGKIKTSNVQDFITKPRIQQAGTALGSSGSPQGKYTDSDRGDYYGPLVIVAILASIAIMSTLVLLLMLVRRQHQNKAPITPPSRVSQSAYDNPTYKVEIQQETMGL